MILYRPVGLQELELLYDSGMNAFPARLPQQPIFYPVLQLEYARQTASGWNAENGQFAGYVTQFKVEDAYIRQFEEHTVGGSQYQELWIPAEEMEEFNKHILGHIKVLEAHFGDAFEGFVPEQFGLKGKNAVEQFTLLANSYLYKRMDFYLEIKRNHKAVFLNYPFWQKYEFKNPGLKTKIIQAIKEAWSTSFPKIPLPLPPPVPGDTPLVKQTHAHSVVDPVREDIRLVEQPDSDSWVDPVQGDFTPVEQSDSDLLVNPIQEHTPPVKQTHAHSVVDPVYKDSRNDSNSFPKPVHPDIPSMEQTYANSLVDPVDEDITPGEETGGNVYLLVNPLHEDVTPVQQTDSDALSDPLSEQIMPVKPTDPYFRVDADQEDTRPAEQPYSRFPVDPVEEDAAFPARSDSHFVQGVKLGLGGKYREATDELSRAVEEDPNHGIAHTSLGVAFRRLGENGRALDCYEAALRIDPNDAEAHYFRANILYDQGNVREAIAGYTIAIGLRPELIEAHEEPAPPDRMTDYRPVPAEMHRIARPARRILDLNNSLAANPREASLFKERAAAYYRLWNYEQAIADYNSSLAIQPDDADVLHFRGVAHEQLGQFEHAREDYRQAVALNPQLADVYLQRGVTFGKMGNLRQSIASLTEGIRLAPWNSDGYFNRGTSYFQLGDFERAIADFSMVIQLFPNDEAAYYWRGISNEAAGRQQDAIADYRQFLRLSQDPDAREEIERKLSRWNVKKRNGVNSQRTALEDGQRTNPAPSEKPDQNFDVSELISALGERALTSTWFVRGLSCYGEKAEELYAFTDQDRPIQGHDLLATASGIRQTIEGDFTAFDPGADSHWILIRAWGGSGFYIEIKDSRVAERLKSRFQSVEEVDGASPPYEGLFVRL